MDELAIGSGDYQLSMPLFGHIWLSVHCEWYILLL